MKEREKAVDITNKRVSLLCVLPLPISQSNIHDRVEKIKKKRKQQSLINFFKKPPLDINKYQEMKKPDKSEHKEAQTKVWKMWEAAVTIGRLHHARTALHSTHPSNDGVGGEIHSWAPQWGAHGCHIRRGGAVLRWRCGENARTNHSVKAESGFRDLFFFFWNTLQYCVKVWRQTGQSKIKLWKLQVFLFFFSFVI